MKGDNFCSCRDSHFWELVPEENIVGKASTVLFSKNEDGFIEDDFKIKNKK